MPKIRHEVRSTDGTSIPVWISGEGRPLLVVHGAVADNTAFDPLREQLDQQVMVAAIDRRPTFSDPLASYALEREFDDIAAVAESLGPEIDLFGHSAGGVCSIGASPRIPNLRRLVLYEPALTDTPFWSAAAQTMRELQAAGDPDGVFESWLGLFGRMPPSAAKKVKHTPMGAELFRWAHTLPAEVEALAGWSCDKEKLVTLRVPTLYLVGAETPRGSHGCLSVLKRVLPDFRVAEIEGQGHFAHHLAPNLLAQRILGFVG